MNFRDRYGTLDRILYDIAFRAGHAQRALADVEDIVYRDRLEDVRIDVPVFITALPRCGTTILLSLLHESGQFAVHTYRDMPFVLCPLFWSRFSRRFAVEDRPVERAHGDGLRVSASSPEAFEEMIWKHFWPEHYHSDRIRPWGPSDEDAEFEAFLESHIRKMILLRRNGGSEITRYASKNNLNIARLASPPRPLRDGQFLIPFREPIQHAASMLEQHRRFTRMHEEDDFVRRFMEAIGHHEFGKGLRPVDFGGWLEKAPTPDALEFWVRYWIASYRHVLENAGLSVRLVSYADLTTEPTAGLARLARVLEVPEEVMVRQADRLHPPRAHPVRDAEVPVAVRAESKDLYEELSAKADV